MQKLTIYTSTKDAATPLIYLFQLTIYEKVIYKPSADCVNKAKSAVEDFPGAVALTTPAIFLAPYKQRYQAVLPELQIVWITCTAKTSLCTIFNSIIKFSPKRSCNFLLECYLVAILIFWSYTLPHHFRLQISPQCFVSKVRCSSSTTVRSFQWKWHLEIRQGRCHKNEILKLTSR